MPTPQDAKTKTSTTYNSAADHYDDEANSFWSRFGRRTIERLELKAGDKVLDVCSGTGASAIPAAEAVGPTGSVVAVDLAEELLKLARSKADQQGLQNIEFRVCDMLEFGTGDHELDAVVCVFGIFFVPDMERAVRKLWQLVRPGGKLAITTWGQNCFEPASSVFWNSIREVRPDLYKGFNPWDRICDPDSLRALFAQAGAEDVSVDYETDTHSIQTPESWWSAVLGSGYRGTVDQLDAKELEQVRVVNEKYIVESGIRTVEANVVYGVAVKR